MVFLRHKPPMEPPTRSNLPPQFTFGISAFLTFLVGTVAESIPVVANCLCTLYQWSGSRGSWRSLAWMMSGTG